MVRENWSKVMCFGYGFLVLIELKCFVLRYERECFGFVINVKICN